MELDGILTLPLANLGGLSELHSIHWCNALGADHAHKPPTAEMTAEGKETCCLQASAHRAEEVTSLCLQDEEQQEAGPS